MFLWSSFYPISLLLGGLTVPDQFVWGAMLHLLVCGLFMYLWLRRIKLPYSAALFGSLLFTFSPFVLIHVNDIDNVMRTVVWIPLIFYAGQVVVDGTEIAGSLLLALALAMMLLAGHVQFTFYTMVSFVLFYMFSSLQLLWAGQRKRAVKIMASFGAVIALAVGLSAIGIFPAWYATQLSTRTASLSWRFVTSFSLTPDQLPQLFSRTLLNGWAPNADVPFLFLGTLTPLLLLVALTRRRAFPWFCAGMILLSLLIALGKFSPLFTLLVKVVPGFSLFRGPKRFLLIYVFFAATLAASALPLLLDRTRRFRWLALLATAATTGSGLLYALLALRPAWFISWYRMLFIHAYRHGYGQSRPLAFYLERLQTGNLAAAQQALLVMLLLFGGFTLLLFLRQRLSTRLWLLLLLIFLLGPYLTGNTGILRFRDTTHYNPQRPLLDRLRADAAGFREHYRLAQNCYLSFNQGTSQQLPCIDGYGGIIIMPFGDLAGVIDGAQPGDAVARSSVAVHNLASPLLSLMATRYLIARPGLPIDTTTALPLARDGEFTLYRNTAACPFITALARRELCELAPAVAQLRDPQFYAGNRPAALLLPPDTDLPPGLGERLPPATVTIQPRTFLPDLRTWEITASGPAYISVAENYYPFWQFELDGRPHATWRGFHYFLATWVPEGRHTLTLRFVPRDLHLGIVTTLLTLVVILLAFYWTVKRRLIHNIRDDENVLFDYLEHTSAALALVRSMEGRLFRRSELQPPILDIGCGDGLFASIVFFQDIDVGIDLDLIELRKRSLPERYRARANANASRLPFRSGHFATVISNCVVEHVRDHTEPLREIHRVLRPGGKYVLTTHSHLYGSYLFWYAACTRLSLPRLAQWYADTINRVFKHYTMLTPQEWTTMLQAAGFHDVRISFYLSRRAMWLFDLLLPMSVPSRLNKALWGRWAVLPRRFLAAVETHVFKRIYREDPAIGAGMCIEARK